MIDIGANLSHKSFRRDLDLVLARARAAGVEVIVITGTSVPASRAAWEIAVARHADAPRLSCTAGVHPHNASTWSREAESELRALASRPEVVAIGECGLDFDRDFSPRDAQLRCFEAQLAIAAELRMPVFLHERAAHDAFAAVLARMRPRLARAVVHCFTGDDATLACYLDLDLHIGITGWICDERRGKHLRASVRRIPSDRLMIETDAPFLMPRDVPKREQPPNGRNEPSLLPYVLRAVAGARGESAESLAQTTRETSRAFFARPRASP
jgi:TatD DNase family protein